MEKKNWEVFRPYYEPFYDEIQLNDTPLLKQYSHACHCFIYAPSSSIVLGKYPAKAAVMMQARFDGLLGFPGGLVKPNEADITEGLNRELQEEINLDLARHRVSLKDHVISFVHHKKKLCLHFFKLQLTLAEFVNLERRTLDAEEYGHETFGLLRIPLYTMEKEFLGFPTFLRQKFAGNARTQLIYTLLNLNIMSQEELLVALKRATEKSAE